jgi:hypothetical protein
MVPVAPVIAEGRLPIDDRQVMIGGLKIDGLAIVD